MLTSSELLAVLAQKGRTISRARLAQLREGHTKKHGEKAYYEAPTLIKGEDWEWVEGKIIYKQSALEKLVK